MRAVLGEQLRRRTLPARHQQGDRQECLSHIRGAALTRAAARATKRAFTRAAARVGQTLLSVMRAAAPPLLPAPCAWCMRAVLGEQLRRRTLPARHQQGDRQECLSHIRGDTAAPERKQKAEAFASAFCASQMSALIRRRPLLARLSCACRRIPPSRRAIRRARLRGRPSS